MQAAATPHVEQVIQRALANESVTELHVRGAYNKGVGVPLTVIDSQRIIACLQQTPRIDTLSIGNYSLHDDAVLNLFRDGIPLCTSITTVKLTCTQSTNEDLDRLRPAFSNTSIRTLDISNNHIEGRRGGEVLRDLLVGNDTLWELYLNGCRLSPEGAIGIKQGLTVNNRLQILNLHQCKIGNDFLANLLPADANLLPADDGSINNSLTKLYLGCNNIQGEDGGQQVSLLLSRFPALKVLDLNYNYLGPLGAHALALGLAAARHLEMLDLRGCGLGNNGVVNLILPDGQVNRSLTNLDLSQNNIEGEDGGRQVNLLLQRFTALKVLDLNSNDSLGPLGAHALAPGLAAARHLEELDLCGCRLGNDGVANLVLDGQVNRSLTNLDLDDNDIEDLEGEENVIALASRCTNLDRITVNDNALSPDQRRRLDMLLVQNRLCKEASTLGGSTFPVLFHFVEKAHRHEHGLSAIFVILQNDGDDYFCIALNRAIE